MRKGVGACILGCSGPELTDEEREFFAEVNPVGFILFARNVVEPDQLRSLTSELRMVVGRNVPILIDQEGGRVQRLRPPHWESWLPAAEQIEAVGRELASRSMMLRARLIAWELNWVGIDVNCVPVADIARAETHEVLLDRCYGTTPHVVTAISRATVEGLRRGGVLPVLKHIPGHGRGLVDSHLELPRVNASWTALQSTDFVPFQSLSNLPFGMTAHIVFDAIDPDNPVTTSHTAISLIRNDIGFGGFLMTDDISMEALSGDLPSRCKASLAAGCDAVLHCNGNFEEMTIVADACGTLSRSASARLGRALARRRPAEPADIPGIMAELQRLMDRGRDG
ncbi:beta-N-acetylhexosaminidase [Rhodovulum sp. P5]|uniref:beta-N-acetylhexosaminidase n=1 Tax=Rhodovulum sp. P5 TaxID=1564506 RepID=UPI0012EC013D|nr:beta-N-acetylhexosaminidase [Rhodovulum sp. P5]